MSIQQHLHLSRLHRLAYSAQTILYHKLKMQFLNINVEILYVFSLLYFQKLAIPVLTDVIHQHCFAVILSFRLPCFNLSLSLIDCSVSAHKIDGWLSSSTTSSWITWKTIFKERKSSAKKLLNEIKYSLLLSGFANLFLLYAYICTARTHIVLYTFSLCEI